jgi:hypothetical protein
VSEDGGIDFIPDLPPAVRRSSIDKAIAEIVELQRTKPISRVRYNAVRDFLNEHRFYLRKADCDALNPLVTSIEEALREQDKARLWIVTPEFVPNTQLDEELFYEKE